MSFVLPSLLLCFAFISVVPQLSYSVIMVTTFAGRVWGDQVSLWCLCHGHHPPFMDSLPAPCSMYCSGNPLGAVIILINVRATPVPSHCSCFLGLWSVSSELFPGLLKGRVSTSYRLLGSRSCKELASYSHETLLLAAALELGSCCCCWGRWEPAPTLVPAQSPRTCKVAAY